jgi:DNA-directed RNA polymerase subunit omega
LYILKYYGFHPTEIRRKEGPFVIFPLEELIEYDQNMYEITSAASRRSYQLSMLKDPEIEENDGKVVSLAAQQVFTREIEFRLDTE